MFVKGQSGNPKGRPKGVVSLAEAIRRSMLEVEPGQSATNASRLVTTLWSMALHDRNLEAIKVILDRVDGKVPTAADPDAEDETILAVADL